jgi:hypothetical protein
MAGTSGAVMAGQLTLIEKLRGAAALAGPPARPALDALTGNWDQTTELVGRSRKPKAPDRGRRKTIYLDEAAEEDLRFLLGEIAHTSARPTRSEGVRRALRATRMAMKTKGGMSL